MIDKLSWIAVYPELVLLVMACVILLTDLFVHRVGQGLLAVGQVPIPLGECRKAQ